MKKHLVTAALGGGIGGLLDITYAIVLWGVILKVGSITILQSVAAGWLGKSSYEGGLATAALGLATHFFIAYCMALVYVIAATKLPVLVHRWLLMGVIYGCILFFAMNFIVVPYLSAIGPRPSTPMGLFRALIPHVIFVGPAIAWFTARRARVVL
jgi:hypothetical protein